MEKEDKDKKKTTMSGFLTCDGCGLQDATVKDMGWKFCPMCDKQMQKSVDAVERNRDRNFEFDGGGAN